MEGFRRLTEAHDPDARCRSEEILRLRRSGTRGLRCSPGPHAPHPEHRPGPVGPPPAVTRAPAAPTEHRGPCISLARPLPRHRGHTCSSPLSGALPASPEGRTPSSSGHLSPSSPHLCCPNADALSLSDWQVDQTTSSATPRPLCPRSPKSKQSPGHKCSRHHAQ